MNQPKPTKVATKPRRNYEGVKNNHLWTDKYNLPVLTRVRAVYRFIVAVVIPDKGNEYLRIDMPTENEAAMLASYQDYLLTSRRYVDAQVEEMRRAGRFYVDEERNSYVFVKRQEQGWAYTPSARGLTLWPAPGEYEFDELVRLLDHIEQSQHLRWQEWKDAHPGVFALSDW